MGGGKSQTSTQTVSIPPEVLARYNAVNARAEETAKQPFQQYGGEFVAPLTPTQQAGIQATSDYSQAAQPYYGAATGLTMAGARGVGPLTRGQIGYYQDPAMLATLAPTAAALQQQQGQQLAQQQGEAIRAGAFGGERAGLQRAQLMGQQQLGMGQALAPIYQQAYQTGLATAQQQQGVLAQDQARRLQAAQQLAGLGTGAQQAALQGAQAQIGAGTLQQQTQQAQDTAQYQQFLQERGYPFQVAQFLANIAEGTGALSGSTTTTTQPSSFFSDRRLKHDAKKIGETKDGMPIYSFKYNGDDRTQIGLMAQDVEKKHPEAVGLAGGYKTVDYEKALRPAKKADGGGLDPNSMGGVVSEPGLFARGGYATAGAVVDPTDLSAILQQQRQSFGPWSAAGPYGQAPGAAPHGASGIVPQQQMHVPKLITAGAAPKPTESGFSGIYKGYQDLNQIAKDMTDKSLTRRLGEATGLVDTPKQAPNDASTKQSPGVVPDQNAASSASAPAPTPAPADASAESSGGLWDTVKSYLPFEEGGVVPRHHYEAGGSSINPYAGRDPSEGYIEDTLEEEDRDKKPELKTASGNVGGGGSSSKLGLGKLAGTALGSFFGPVGSVFGGTLGSLLPFEAGGVVPRQHFLDGGDAEQPAIDADASFNRAVGNLLKREGGLGIDNNGARVNFGMNQASHPDIDVRELTPETAAQRYRTHYWNAIGGDRLPPDLANVALDTAAMAGPGKANQLLKTSGGDPLEMLHQRHQFLANLVSSGNPQYGPQVAKAWQSRYENMVNELGGKPQSNLLAYLPQGQGLGQAAGQQAIQRATSGQNQGLDGAEKPGFFESNKQYILPILQGLGAMAGSKSRYLGSAILEGLGAGAKAYGDVEAQQAGIKQTEAGTTGTQAQTQAVLAAISKGAGIPRADGTIAAYRVYINGRPTTVSASEFIRALQAGTPYETAPPVGPYGGTSKGAPEVEQGSSSFLPPQIPAEQNKMHLLQPGVSIDEQAFANAKRDAGSPTMTMEQSRKIKSDIDNAASAAANNRGTVNELANNTANLISQGVSGTGSLAAPRSQVLNAANTIYKLVTGTSLPEGYDGSDLQINRKIASYLAGLQTSSVNQNNANAFMSALEGAPNANLPPRALAAITSLIMVQNDRPQGLQKFADTYGEASAGNFSGNVVSNYDRIHARQQQAEQHNLADLFVKAPKAAAKIASGEIPYDVAAERLKQLYPKTPDLIRHLQNR